MGEKLRAGVVGTGMGRYHMEGYANNPNVDLVAICDLNEPEAKEMAQRFGASEVYTDWEKFVARDLDIISVAAPNYLHAPITIAALESGKNVLCEKPMAARLPEAEGMVRAAERTGKTLLIDMTIRYYPTSRLLRQLTDKGAFGDVYWAEAKLIRRRGCPRLDMDSSGTMGRGEWFVREHLAGGGAIMDIGVHAMDLVWWTMGSPKPTAVRAMTFERLRKEEAKERGVIFDVDHHASAFVTFETGAGVFFEVTWDANQPNSWDLHLFGDNAGATLSPPDLTLHELKGAEPVDTKPEAPEELNVSAYDHMVNCTLDPKLPRLSEGKECIWVARILDGVQRSARAGREVTVG